MNYSKQNSPCTYSHDPGPGPGPVYDFNAIRALDGYRQTPTVSSFPYVNGSLLLVEQAPLKICEKLEEIIDHLGDHAYWEVLYEDDDLLLAIDETNIIPSSFSPVELVTQLKTICVHLRQKLSQKEMSQVYWEGSIIFSIDRGADSSQDHLIQGIVAADDPLITICYHEETVEIITINVSQ